MPIAKGSRLWDPARNVPSTHRASPVRSYVYEQLGISKPGFWADWRKRTIDEPEPEEYTPDEQNEINDPSQEYHLAKWPEQEKAKKKDFTPMEMYMGTPQEQQAQHRPAGVAWAPLLRSQSKAWFKQNPLLTSDSSLNLMGLEKAVINKQAADYLENKGTGGVGYKGLTSLAKFYAQKAQERANARANRPFGQGEPTNFDKMLALVGKPAPIYKPPTYEVLKQGTEVLVSQLPDYTIGQLNVSANGYVTNPTTPQKQAANMLAAKTAGSTLQTARAVQPSKSSGLQAAGKVKV